MLIKIQIEDIDDPREWVYLTKEVDEEISRLHRELKQAREEIQSLRSDVNALKYGWK